MRLKTHFGQDYVLSGARYMKYKGNESDVTVPDGIIVIGEEAFVRCKVLKSVSLPKTAVEIGSRAFAGCGNLTKIIFSDRIRKIGAEAFPGCYSLKSIDLPDSITVLGEGAFRDCSHISEVTIPAGLIEIEANTFHGCTGLRVVRIPDSVKKIHLSAFDKNPVLEFAVKPRSFAEQYAKALGIHYYHTAPVPSRISSDVPHKDTQDANNPRSVLLDRSDFMIKDGTLLSYSGHGHSVIIPNGVLHIGPEAFKGHDEIETVTIPSGTLSIGRAAFSACRNLSDVSLPESLAVLNPSAFMNCSELRSIHIPAGVRFIQNSVFADCVSLCDVLLENGVESIKQNAFKGCPELTIHIPPSVKSIAENAFSRKGSVTVAATSGSYATQYAVNLGFQLRIENAVSSSMSAGITASPEAHEKSPTPDSQKPSVVQFPEQNNPRNKSADTVEKQPTLACKAQDVENAPLHRDDIRTAPSTSPAAQPVEKSAIGAAHTPIAREKKKTEKQPGTVSVGGNNSVLAPDDKNNAVISGTRTTTENNPTSGTPVPIHILSIDEKQVFLEAQGKRFVLQLDDLREYGLQIQHESTDFDSELEEPLL